MTTLVTGAQGFIGSWLVSRLLDDREEVLVLDWPAREGSRFARERLGERVRSVSATLEDGGALRRALDGVDTVFHLAAQPLVGPALRDPAATFEVNIGGVWRVLDAAREAGVSRFVLASSYLAYGRDGKHNEESPLRPTSPYGASQAAADLVATAFAAACDMPVAIVRMGNVYGGGDLHFSRIVPEAARALAAGARPTILSDGSPERDFLYVEDAVAAYLAVAGGRGIWNAGSGDGISILDLVLALVRASGRDVEPDVRGTPRADGAIDRQLFDTTRIRTEVGWTPTHDLEAGLAKTWAWYAEALGA